MDHGAAGSRPVKVTISLILPAVKQLIRSTESVGRSTIGLAAESDGWRW
jgi:hypothetical protein